MEGSARPASHRTASGQAEQPQGRVVSSKELFQGQRELWIDHEGQVYRLRITARGNLYLTK